MKSALTSLGLFISYIKPYTQQKFGTIDTKHEVLDCFSSGALK